MGKIEIPIIRLVGDSCLEKRMSVKNQVKKINRLKMAYGTEHSS